MCRKVLFVLFLLSGLLVACTSTNATQSSTETGGATSQPVLSPTQTLPPLPTEAPTQPPTETPTPVFIDAIYYRESAPNQFDYFHFYPDGQVTNVMAKLNPPADVYETYKLNRRFLEPGKPQENITGQYRILDGKIEFQFSYPAGYPKELSVVSGTYSDQQITVVFGDEKSALYLLYDGEP